MSSISPKSVAAENSLERCIVDFMQRRIPEPEFAKKVREILQSQRKEAAEFVDRQLQDKVFIVNPEFLPKIHPILVQAAINPEARKNLEEMVDLVKALGKGVYIEEREHVSDPFAASILSGLGMKTGSCAHLRHDGNFHIDLCFEGTERGLFEDTSGSWYIDSIFPQRTFEHEAFHINQIAKGTFIEMQKKQSLRWSNEAEREAIEVENRVSFARGDRKRLCHLAIPNWKTKTEEFVVGMMFGCDGTVRHLLTDYFENSKNSTAAPSKDRFKLFDIPPSLFVPLLSKIESEAVLEEDKLFFSEINKRRLQIFEEMISIFCDQGCYSMVRGILKSCDPRTIGLLLKDPQGHGFFGPKPYIDEMRKKREKVFINIITMLDKLGCEKKVLEIIDQLDHYGKKILADIGVPRLKSKKLEFAIAVKVGCVHTVNRLLREGARRAQIEMINQMAREKIEEVIIAEVRRLKDTFMAQFNKTLALELGPDADFIKSEVAKNLEEQIIPNVVKEIRERLSRNPPPEGKKLLLGEFNSVEEMFNLTDIEKDLMLNFDERGRDECDQKMLHEMQQRYKYILNIVYEVLPRNGHSDRAQAILEARNDRDDVWEGIGKDMDEFKQRLDEVAKDIKINL